MDSPGLEWNWQTSFCHDITELLCSIESRIFHDQLNNYKVVQI